MGYVSANLLQDEQVAHEAKLHGIVFLGPTLVLLPGLLMLGGGDLAGGAPFLIVPALAWGLGVALNYWTSEFAVTNRRILAKVGLIQRRSLEVNLSKVESIEVNQSILGRILNYGTIVVRGTGGTREPFKNVADPLALRMSAQKQAAFAQATPSAVTRREERDCPFCGETILAKAKVCKHCGREVSPLVTS
jgi:uncharacterized membrane protein YdbT with pleckstrin-like domain